MVLWNSDQVHRNASTVYPVIFGVVNPFRHILQYIGELNILRFSPQHPITVLIMIPNSVILPHWMVKGSMKAFEHNATMITIIKRTLASGETA